MTSTGQNQITLETASSLFTYHKTLGRSGVLSVMLAGCPTNTYKYINSTNEIHSRNRDILRLNAQAWSHCCLDYNVWQSRQQCNH